MSALPLPSYRKPPVFEVGLAAQFTTEKPLSPAALYGAHRLFEREFPELEEQASAPPMAATLSGSALEIALSDVPPSPRLWFVTAEGDRLVQLQADRLIVNWRRHQGDESYPRYHYMREMFSDAWSKLVGWCEQIGVGAPQVDLCEIVYVNPIEADGVVWSRHGEAHKVFRCVAPPAGDFLPEPRELGIGLSYDMPDSRGWLHAQIMPARRATTQAVVYVMTMTARGPALSPDEAGAIGFFGLGREWIVRGFTALTTSEMHERWEQE